MKVTAWKTSSAGILPAVPRASRPRRGGRGRPPDSRRDGGATLSDKAVQIMRSRYWNTDTNSQVTGPRYPSCLVQGLYLQLDKAVVADNTGGTCRYLRGQRSKVEVVGVGT